LNSSEVGLETDPTEQHGGTSAESAGETAASTREGRGGDSSHEGFNIFRQPWFFVACLLLVASAVLLVLSHPDAAFVCAALGVSAWFWNVRGNLKRKHNLKKLGGRNWGQRGDEED